MIGKYVRRSWWTQSASAVGLQAVPFRNRRLRDCGKTMHVSSNNLSK
jgi:hypothetical protein